jgi:hypothetical protein
MAAKTRRDLVDRALEILGVLAAGQAPAPEDVARVDGYVDTTVADLIARDIYYVDDVDEVDPAIFDDLAKVLGNNCREAFGLASDPALPAIAAAAENKLQVKSSQGPTYRTLRTSYF